MPGRPATRRSSMGRGRGRRRRQPGPSRGRAAGGTGGPPFQVGEIVQTEAQEDVTFTGGEQTRAIRRGCAERGCSHRQWPTPPGDGRTERNERSAPPRTDHGGEAEREPAAARSPPAGGVGSPPTRPGATGRRRAGRRSRSAPIASPRRAPGATPSSLRIVSLNWRREPKPAAKATSTNGIELCEIRARAVWTRRLRAS